MRERLAAMALAAIVLAIIGTGCTINVNSASETSNKAATPACAAYCERVADLAEQECQTDTSGQQCGDLLTPKALLAMSIRDDRIVTDAETLQAARQVVTNGEEFADARCFTQTVMSLGCRTIASTIEAAWQTIDRRIRA